MKNSALIKRGDDLVQAHESLSVEGGSGEEECETLEKIHLQNVPLDGHIFGRKFRDRACAACCLSG